VLHEINRPVTSLRGGRRSDPPGGSGGGRPSNDDRALNVDLLAEALGVLLVGGTVGAGSEIVNQARDVQAAGGGGENATCAWLLDLTREQVTTYPFAEVNAANTHAAIHGRPFRRTVLNAAPAVAAFRSGA